MIENLLVIALESCQYILLISMLTLKTRLYSTVLILEHKPPSTLEFL